MLIYIDTMPFIDIVLMQAKSPEWDGLFVDIAPTATVTNHSVIQAVIDDTIETEVRMVCYLMYSLASYPRLLPTLGSLAVSRRDTARWVEVGDS